MGAGGGNQLHLSKVFVGLPYKQVRIRKKVIVLTEKVPVIGIWLSNTKYNFLL